ncbi:MAG: hypothetical protein LBT55_05335 [Clostridiaceae bacterium]|nr:hypothetical protein [Clostridiaceae bacterium]
MSDDKTTVTISSAGSGGNIYAILAAVRAEMRKRRLIQAYNDLYFDCLNSESYEAAIKRIRETVKLIDTDGRV